MRLCLKRLLWIVAIYLAVWLMVIVCWQSTSRLPLEADLRICLKPLPLLLAGPGWMGILLPCESGSDQDYVDALASKDNLFGGKNNAGAKPGEVAVGLLFTDAKQSLLLSEGPFSSVHRASWAARDKPADEYGKVTADLLDGIADLALETSKVALAKIEFVSADNDHKPGREAELTEMLAAKLPELDCTKDTAKIAQACGSTHHAATAAALCVAHQYVVDEHAPALCTSLQYPFLRAAVVLSVAQVKEDPDLSASSKPEAA